MIGVRYNRFDSLGMTKVKPTSIWLTINKVSRLVGGIRHAGIPEQHQGIRTELKLKKGEK